MGDRRALEYPLSISRTWQDTPDTRTQTQRDETTPENKSIFNYFFFSFQPFWDLAHLLWDRRIRENHESSQKVFVHVKEEGGKQHQKKKEIKKAEKLFPFSTHSSGALGKNEHFSSHLVPLEEKSKCLSVLNACNYIHRKLRSKTK